MKWTVLVPTHFNDGKPVEQMNEILKEIVTKFGGMTIEGKTNGVWIDPTDGQRYDDEALKVSVVTEGSRLPEVFDTVKNLGRLLDQKAMYLEIQYADGVHFLRTDE